MEIQGSCDSKNTVLRRAGTENPKYLPKVTALARQDEEPAGLFPQI